MAMTERWVGVDDVAAHLGVAKDSVYRWIEGRGLPAHRVGRLFRFKLSEIDNWVRQDSRRKAGNQSQSCSPSASQKNHVITSKTSPRKRGGNRR